MIKVHGQQQKQLERPTPLNTSRTMVGIKPRDFQLPSSHVRTRSLKDGIASGASLDKAQQSPAPKARTFTITPDNRKQKERATQKPEEIQEQSTSHTSPKLTLSSPMVVHSLAPSTAADDDGDEFFDCAETEEDLRKLQAQESNSLSFSPIQTVHMYSQEPSLETAPANTITAGKKPLFTGWSKVSSGIAHDVKSQATKDISALHEEGHWGRDMREIAIQHYVIKQAKVWLPPVLLGIAGFITGVSSIAATLGTATPIVLGVAAAAWATYSAFIRAKTWPTRESNKANLSEHFTKAYREHKAESFTANSGFSQYKNLTLNRIYFNLIEHTNAKLHDLRTQTPHMTNTERNTIYKNIDLDLDKTSEFSKVLELIFEDPHKKMSPSEITKLRQHLPDIIIGLREFSTNFDATNISTIKQARPHIVDYFKNSEKFNGLDLDNFLKHKKYSDHLNKSNMVHGISVAEITEEQLKTYMSRKASPSQFHLLDKALNNPLDKAKDIVSIKKFDTYVDSNTKITRYRVYYTQELNTNAEIDIKEIKKNIMRSIMTRGEILGAKHATDSLQNLLVSMVFDNSTQLNASNIELAKQLNSALKFFHKEEFAQIQASSREEKSLKIESTLRKLLEQGKSWCSKNNFELIYTLASNEYLLWNQGDNSKSALGVLDKKADMAADESDFLLHEHTACRNPHSNHGKDVHGFARAWKKSTEMLKNTLHDSDSDSDKNKVLEYSAINLPFDQKLHGQSTHFSPFHQDKYLNEMSDVNLINYKGADNTKTLSRKGMKKIHAEAHKQFKAKNTEDPNGRPEHYYSKSGLSSKVLTETEYKQLRQKTESDSTSHDASFGPIEENNSRSIVNAIKRFNSSRDIQLIMASAYKKEAQQNQSQTPQPIFKDFDLNNLDSEITWSEEPVLRDMNHALNVSILHTEINKLEASIGDLRHAIKQYSERKGSLPVELRKLALDNGYKEYQGGGTTETQENFGRLDIMMHQKEIKRMCAEVADNFHSLFKTQTDYQIAYSVNNNSSYDQKHKDEMYELFNVINKVSQDKDVKKIFHNVHDAIHHTRNRNFASMNAFNNFKGRARLPFAKMTTFKGVINRLLSKDNIDDNQFATFDKAVKSITQLRFEMEDKVFQNQKENKSETYENIEYLEGLSL